MKNVRDILKLFGNNNTLNSIQDASMESLLVDLAIKITDRLKDSNAFVEKKYTEELSNFVKLVLFYTLQ